MEESTCKKENGNKKSACKADQKAAKIVLDANLTDLVLKPKSEKVSRPPNAFMIFARENRKPLARKYPEQTNKVISSMLGTCWKSMDKTEKDPYFEQAKMMQQLHKNKHPGYVYSPRVARMKKLEKQRRRKQNARSKDVKKEINKPGKGRPDKDEIGGTEANLPGDEANHPVVDLKQLSPEYVPNNPLYLPEPPGLHHQETAASLFSEARVPAGPSVHYPRLTEGWHSPPYRSATPSSVSSSPEEFVMPPSRETCYQRQQARQCQPCACWACQKQSMYPPRWEPYAMDYMNEYGATASSFNRSRSSYPPSDHPVYKNHFFPPYQHCATSALYENTPRFYYDPYNDFKPSFCSLPNHYINWKNSYEDQARSYYSNRQPEWFAGSRYNYSNPATQANVSQNNFTPRPEYMQSPQYFKYTSEQQYRDLNSSTLPPMEIISKSCSSLKSERIIDRGDTANISIQQWIAETTQATASQNNFTPRPEYMQHPQYFKDTNEQQHQDLDRSTLPHVETILKSCSNLKSERIARDIDDMKNISVKESISDSSQELESAGLIDKSNPEEARFFLQDNTLTKQPCSREVEVTGLSQSGLTYDYESNSIELRTEKNCSIYVQAKDVQLDDFQSNKCQANNFHANVCQANDLAFISYRNESDSHNLESGDVSEPELGSQGFVFQTHGEDELINVVDVMEDPHSCNNEVQQVLLEKDTDTKTEKSVQ